MKVYVVTEGEYSDYGINCIFSSHEAAQRFIGENLRDARVEEYELDVQAGVAYRKIYSCRIALNSHPAVSYTPAVEGGEITDEADWHRKLIPFSSPRYSHVEIREWDLRKPSGKPFYAQEIIGKQIVADVETTVSAEHCLKLAVEARQAWLRKEGFERFNEGEARR